MIYTLIDVSTGMSAERNTSGAYAALLSIDVKFVNNFKNKKPSSFMHTIIFLSIGARGLLQWIMIEM